MDENLLLWAAASLVVSYAVLVAVRLDEGRRPRVGLANAAWQSLESRSLELPQAHGGEGDRGRIAGAPPATSRRRWKDMLWRAYADILRHRIFLIAAGVAFYSLLALFPAITAGVSFYALFADPHTISDHLSLLVGIVPASALDIVRDEVARIAAQSNGKLTFGFLLGLGFALWSTNAGMKAVFDALNIIHDANETRGFIRLNVVSLLLTVGAIGGMLLSVAAVVVLPLALNVVGLPAVSDSVFVYLRWPALLLLTMLSLAVLYRFGPSRQHAGWQWLSLGSVFAALAWLAASAAFSWYLGNFANYNVTYGALGAVIGLMMWIWLSTVMVLVGAELDAVAHKEKAGRSATPVLL